MQAVSEGLMRFKWWIAFAAIVVVGIGAFRTVSGITAYRLKVPLDSAAGLYPGSDVMVAGSRVGSVEDVKPGGPGALVTITIDPDHAPVRSDATVTLRPKSLLGEKYLALDPGKSSSTLASGSTVPEKHVSASVDLQQVINTLDAPTREKLQTLLLELGAGVAGRGAETNAAIAYGTQDMHDLNAITTTLADRDADLEQVIQSLNQVTSELAQSDRREQLGAFIQNLEALLRDLNEQDTELKRALTETDSALTRTDNALSGTGQNWNDIFTASPQLVSQAGELTGDLGRGLDTLVPLLPQFAQSIREGPVVFGAHDANGYATRIDVLVGCATTQACPKSQPAPAPTGPSGLPPIVQGLLGGLHG
jgi:phospholipid/cholesterol/gamma-HCH transport system substrate-binding protein